MEYKFAVEPRSRHVKVITDEKGDTIEGGIGHTSPAEKALNEVRVRATLSIVDWIGVPLTGYRVELTDEGHQVHADEAKGAPLAFPEVLVHTANGMLHVEAKPAGSGAFGPRGLHLKGDLPYQYTKDSQDIVLRGWQRFETQDVQKAKLHSYTDQLTKSGKVSFKIFDDVGGEVSLAEATSDTDTTSEATTYHVRIAHEGLSDQEQK
jgi:hypothetical protein